jgi:hypothetical protein
MSSPDEGVVGWACVCVKKKKARGTSRGPWVPVLVRSKRRRRQSDVVRTNTRLGQEEQKQETSRDFFLPELKDNAMRFWSVVALSLRPQSQSAACPDLAIHPRASGSCVYSGSDSSALRMYSSVQRLVLASPSYPDPVAVDRRDQCV